MLMELPNQFSNFLVVVSEMKSKVRGHFDNNYNELSRNISD